MAQVVFIAKYSFKCDAVAVGFMLLLLVIEN